MMLQASSASTKLLKGEPPILIAPLRLWSNGRAVHESHDRRDSDE
jgi:hypothetical protein